MRLPYLSGFPVSQDLGIASEQWHARPTLATALLSQHVFLNPVRCDLVPTPLAAGRCLFIRQNQAIPFEPKIAILIM
jgi:hypothetical protein